MKNSFTIHLLQKHAGDTVLTYCGMNNGKMKKAVVTTNCRDIVTCLYCQRKWQQRQDDLKKGIGVVYI